MKNKFISLVRIEHRTLNGEIVETKEHFAVNASMITHVFPDFRDRRCTVYVSDEMSGWLVDIDYDTLLHLLNEE